MNELTNQDVKALLAQYPAAKAEIEALERELTEWTTIREHITANYSGMPRGGGGDDRLFNTTNKIIALEQEINDRIGDRVKLRGELERLLDGVKDDKLRLLLRYRYIDGRTWEMIAVMMQYDVRQIYRLHGTALTVVRRCMEAEQETCH